MIISCFISTEDGLEGRLSVQHLFAAATYLAVLTFSERLLSINRLYSTLRVSLRTGRSGICLFHKVMQPKFNQSSDRAVYVLLTLP